MALNIRRQAEDLFHSHYSTCLRLRESVESMSASMSESERYELLVSAIPSDLLTVFTDDVLVKFFEVEGYKFISEVALAEVRLMLRDVKIHWENLPWYSKPFIGFFPNYKGAAFYWLTTSELDPSILLDGSGRDNDELFTLLFYGAVVAISRGFDLGEDF